MQRLYLFARFLVFEFVNIIHDGAVAFEIDRELWGGKIVFVKNKYFWVPAF